MKNDFLSHKLLVSTPGIDQGLFHKGLVLVIEHNAEGAFGLLINKPTEHSLAEIFVDLNLQALPPTTGDTLYQGGPLGVDRGFILHSSGMLWPSTVRVTNEIFLTTSQEILEDISKGLGPSEYLVALGYSSWAAGQLEEELKENAWIIAEPKRHLIFSKDTVDRYQMVADSLEVDLSLITQHKGLQ